jgi:hypothetical protein
MILVVLPSTTPATLPVNIPAWKDTGTNRNRRVKRGKTNLSIDRLRAPWWQRGAVADPALIGPLTLIPSFLS